MFTHDRHAKNLSDPDLSGCDEAVGLTVGDARSRSLILNTSRCTHVFMLLFLFVYPTLATSGSGRWPTGLRVVRLYLRNVPNSAFTAAYHA